MSSRGFLLLLPALLPVLLAACLGAAAAPRPDSVRLSSDSLRLRLTDGTICETGWSAAAPAGRLESCGPGYGYAVHVEDNPNLFRQLIGGIFLALGAEDVLAPLAEVVITDSAGTDWVFNSPDPATP